MDTDYYGFNRIVRRKVGFTKAVIIIQMVGVALIGVFLFRLAFAVMAVPAFLIACIPFLGVWFMLRYHKGVLKGGDYWMDLLENDPKKIVWIKPIRVHHKAAHIVTVHIEMRYQVYTSDGINILIKPYSQQDERDFLSGLKHYVPHAHYGYSKAIRKLYRADPETFLEKIKLNKMYAPLQKSG